MFYLLFLWLLFIESIIDWKGIIENKPRKASIIGISIACALIPTFYILSINFLGLNQAILDLGQYFKIGTGDFIFFHWPLSCEYFVFFISFTVTIIVAYKMQGLKTFSISLSLLGGISAAYMFDTIYPFGIFKPLQEFALPTAATTAALFDLLGYKTALHFPVRYGESNLPTLSISASGRSASVAIAWACAGVHSLLLYALIIFVFFKKVDISDLRKFAYFIIGLLGTYLVNVLRIFSILLIMLNIGQEAGIAFHDTYGELYFFSWMFFYIALITVIQKFMVIERIKNGFQKMNLLLEKAKNKLESKLRMVKIKKT